MAEVAFIVEERGSVGTAVMNHFQFLCMERAHFSGMMEAQVLNGAHVMTSDHLDGTNRTGSGRSDVS